MKDKKSSVKIGICMWCIPGNGSSAVQTASEMGYSGLVADLGKADEKFPISDKNEILRTRKDCDHYGLTVTTLAINELCRTGMSKQINYENIKSIFNLAVKTAVELGANLLQLPSFVDGFIKTEDEFANTAACLKYACQVAGEKGLLVGTENALTAKDNFRMLDVVAEPNLRLYFDTANPLWLAGGMYAPDMLKEMRPMICEVHAKEVKRETDSSNYLFVPLGNGQTDFEKSIQILRETGYQGWIHVENELSKELLKKDCEWLQSWFS